MPSPDAATVPLRCRLGLHRWEKLGTARWLDEPAPAENRLGGVLEYRKCERCPAITDVSSFFSERDPDLGVPMRLGPLAGARFLEVVNGPRTPLTVPPIPWRTDGKP